MASLRDTGDIILKMGMAPTVIEKYTLQRMHWFSLPRHVGSTTKNGGMFMYVAKFKERFVQYCPNPNGFQRFNGQINVHLGTKNWPRLWQSVTQQTALSCLIICRVTLIKGGNKRLSNRRGQAPYFEQPLSLRPSKSDVFKRCYYCIHCAYQKGCFIEFCALLRTDTTMVESVFLHASKAT